MLEMFFLVANTRYASTGMDGCTFNVSYLVSFGLCKNERIRLENDVNVCEFQDTQTAHPDLVQGLRRHLEENVNAKNVIKLLNSFLK